MEVSTDYSLPALVCLKYETKADADVRELISAAGAV
jgi:hypothetical protein